MYIGVIAYEDQAFIGDNDYQYNCTSLGNKNQKYPAILRWEHWIRKKSRRQYYYDINHIKYSRNLNINNGQGFSCLSGQCVCESVGYCCTHDGECVGGKVCVGQLCVQP